MSGSSIRLRRRLVAALVLAAWAVVGLSGTYRYIHGYWLYRGFPPPQTPAGIPPGETRTEHFLSAALHKRSSYIVYTPPGYAEQAAAGRRFPVLYLLHAPPGRPDGYFLAGAIGVQADVLLARRRIGPMLMVVPDGHTSKLHNDTEWANARAGRYMDFVMDTVRDVDSRFATRADRGHRVIGGLSEGGYGALNVALHHLDAFSGAQSWSGYFEQTATGAFTGASPARLRADSPLAEIPGVAAQIRGQGFRAWLYQGRTDFTAAWRITTFGAALAQAGADVRVGFFRGGHDWGLWRAQVPRMLGAASRWFARDPASTRPALVQVGHPLAPGVLHRILYDPRRHCLIRHPPPGFKFPHYCDAIRAAHGLGAHSP